MLSNLSVAELFIGESPDYDESVNKSSQTCHPRPDNDQWFKLQIPLGFGGGQALAEDGGWV